MAVVDHAYNYMTDGDLEAYERRGKSWEVIDDVLSKRAAHEQDRFETCIHEAGHAAMMRYFFGPDVVLSAMVKSSGAGETIAARQPKAEYHVLVSIYAAGAAAEGKFLGRMPDVCADDRFLDDLAAVRDCRKHWRKPGSVTRAFSEAAIAVKEEILDREPDVWNDALSIAHALAESPNGQILFQPELAAELEQDRRVKQYMGSKRPRASKSFRRLMRNANEFWTESGYL
jgi:hypothetical protein